MEFTPFSRVCNIINLHRQSVIVCNLYSFTKEKIMYTDLLTIHNNKVLVSSITSPKAMTPKLSSKGNLVYTLLETEFEKVAIGPGSYITLPYNFVYYTKLYSCSPARLVVLTANKLIMYPSLSSFHLESAFTEVGYDLKELRKSHERQKNAKLVLSDEYTEKYKLPNLKGKNKQKVEEALILRAGFVNILLENNINPFTYEILYNKYGSDANTWFRFKDPEFVEYYIKVEKDGSDIFQKYRIYKEYLKLQAYAKEKGESGTVSME